MIVELLVHVALELALGGLKVGRERPGGPSCRAHFGHVSQVLRPALRLGDHVVYHHADLRADQFCEFAIERSIGKALLDRKPASGDEGMIEQFF